MGSRWMGPAPQSGPGAFIGRLVDRVSRCLGWRLVVILTASLFLLLGFSGWLSIALHRRHLYSLLEETAIGLGETILSSTHLSMLENDRRHLSEILDNIGQRESVLALRLIDARGQVRYSKHAEEIGRRSDLTEPLCQGCHLGPKMRVPVSLRDGLQVYSLPSGEGALGLGVPVLNAPECADAACHVHPSQQAVLGILDLELSTQPLESALSAARAQTATLAFLTMLVTSGVIGVLTWRVVHRPLHGVLAGIRHLAGGDLAHRIQVTSPGEIGEVAEAFNDLSHRLESAHAELEAWNQTLEAKVAEKTRELEHTRDQMVFAEKMASLGKLAAIVAHEINNPLAGILVYTKLVRRRIPKLEKATPPGTNGYREIDDTLATIQAETARCGDIVRNLLLFSRRGETSREPADLNAVLQRALRLVQHQADLSEVTTRLDLYPDLPPVVCDTGEIQQAVLAALMNALEAMPDGGDLVVRSMSHPAEGAVSLEIEDTGVGIAPEIRSRIFEPFFSTKSEGKGTGLGLAVLYGIVQRHGGRIAFDSEVGKGTKFRIWLPRNGAEERPDLGEDEEGKSP